MPSEEIEIKPAFAVRTMPLKQATDVKRDADSPSRFTSRLRLSHLTTINEH